jgi:Short C-terminal domain
VACYQSANTRACLRVAHIFATLILACSTASAGAEEKVLIEILPTNIDTTTTLRFAREALEYREWTIVKQDADSVQAKISRNLVDAKIRIYQNGNKLVYEDSARGRPKLDHTGRAVPSTTEAPSRWIYYLRSDITEKLQAYVAEAAAPAPAATPPTAAVASNKPARPHGSRVQRMKELKEMYDCGLISADEYTRKRAQILDEL